MSLQLTIRALSVPLTYEFRVAVSLWASPASALLFALQSAGY